MATWYCAVSEGLVDSPEDFTLSEMTADNKAEALLRLLHPYITAVTMDEKEAFQDIIPMLTEAGYHPGSFYMDETSVWTNPEEMGYLIVASTPERVDELIVRIIDGEL